MISELILSSNSLPCVSLSLSHAHCPPPLPSLPSVSHAHIHTHIQGGTRGRIDAVLSAVSWEVLLLTVVWIEAAVHPLLSGCCRAAGLAFVLRLIMAHYNYSLRGENAHWQSLPYPLPHLTLQGERYTQSVCMHVNVSLCVMCVTANETSYFWWVLISLFVFLVNSVN